MRRHPSPLLAALLLAASTASLSGQSDNVYSILPQLAVGGVWSSDISVNNQDDKTAGVQLELFTGQGAPLQVTTNLGTDSEFFFTVAPGATKIITLTSTGPTQTGYALLFFPDDVSIRTSLVVRWRQNGQVMTQLGVTQQFPFSHYSFPAEVDPATQTNTGVALALPARGLAPGRTYDVIVSLIDEEGELHRRSVVPLVPGQHLAKMLTEAPLFPQLTSFKGSVSVSCAEPFGLIALRLEQAALGSLTISRGPVIAPYILLQPPTNETEPNNVSAQGSSLTLPALAVGTIGSAGDIDCFRFQGNTGDLITALTSTRWLGSAADTILTLFQPDGQALFTNDQNGLMSGNDSFVQAVLPETGTYVLQVKEYSNRGGTQFGYELHVSKEGGSSPIPAPVISTISPSSAAAGSQNVSLTISGTDLSGASAVTFTPSSGVTVGNIQSTATQVTALLSIMSVAATGVRQVTVTTPGGTSNSLPFTISSSTGFPEITSVSPSSMVAGTNNISLKISGSNLSGATAVVFTPPSGVTVKGVQSTSSQVTASVDVAPDAATGERQVTVTTPGGISNALPITIAAANTPQISWIQPSSGRAGTTVNVTIVGDNLSGVTQVNISPPDGITVSNVVPEDKYDLHASLTIAASAPVTFRQVSVTTPSGTSNSVQFAVAPPTTGTAPTISNLTVGTPQYTGSNVSIPIRFDFSDPDADIIYVAGNYTGSAKLIFSKSGCTRTIASSVLNRPGATSGTFNLNYTIISGAVSGDFKIDMQLEDAAGNRSNTLTFQINVWSCELLPGDRDQSRQTPGDQDQVAGLAEERRRVGTPGTRSAG